MESRMSDVKEHESYARVTVEARKKSEELKAKGSFVFCSLISIPSLSQCCSLQLTQNLTVWTNLACTICDCTAISKPLYHQTTLSYLM